jgi:hypothetical protein
MYSRPHLHCAYNCTQYCSDSTRILMYILGATCDIVNEVFLTVIPIGSGK